MPAKSPNVFHPTVPSAVGSRNSLAQDGRKQKDEFRQLIEEESENILSDIKVKLPEKVLQELDVMGGLKEKLFNYFNQNYQNMFNRYITTSEDEMVKKVRNFVDKEEDRVLARYTPREIAELLDKIGGFDKFNTGEVEKSVINMYGHLQGHIQRGLYDLEVDTNALLRQKADVGAFIRGENAYSVVKCAFKDNGPKPKTVTDVKLSVNVLATELISPIFQYQATVEYIIKDQISRTITSVIDQEVEQFQEQLVDEGRNEMTDTEMVFEKIKRIPNHTDDERDDEGSNRYRLIAKNLVDRIEGLRAEIDPKEFDALNVRENIKKVIDSENIRSRGFNTAVNSLTSILDTSKMGYQYIENLKNARELILREYEDIDPDNLPDERYQIRMKFYDTHQLLKERETYDKQMEAFKNEIQHVYNVSVALYKGGKNAFRVEDFDDLTRKLRGRVNRESEERDEQLYEEVEKTWNEICNIRVDESEVERLNRTYTYEKTLLKKLLTKAVTMAKTTFGHRNTRARLVIEDRMSFLEKEFEKFDYIINPYHVQAGLLLDVDITSIKRKRYTLNGMSNVLNEFLHRVSRGFRDAAFAEFSRRRSTVRSDLDQSYASGIDTEGDEPGDYGTRVPTPVKKEVARSTNAKVRGKANVTPATPKRGRGRPRLQEL